MSYVYLVHNIELHYHIECLKLFICLCRMQIKYSEDYHMYNMGYLDSMVVFDILVKRQ
jgi:hypothetical protein